MSMVNAQQQHFIRRTLVSLLIRMIPVLRHKQAAEMLAERVQEIKASLEHERDEREALVARSKELEESKVDERQMFQARVKELEEFRTQVLFERQIERFAVRQDNTLFRVYSHSCPQCHTYYGGFFFEKFEEARKSANYLNEVASVGVQHVLCNACSVNSALQANSKH
ncbi:MAG: hypothetical protein ACYCYO_20770 [Bacilli bacterium]